MITQSFSSGADARAIEKSNNLYRCYKLLSVEDARAAISCLYIVSLSSTRDCLRPSLVARLCRILSGLALSPHWLLCLTKRNIYVELEARDDPGGSNQQQHLEQTRRIDTQNGLPMHEHVDGRIIPVNNAVHWPELLRQRYGYRTTRHDVRPWRMVIEMSALYVSLPWTYLAVDLT